MKYSTLFIISCFIVLAGCQQNDGEAKLNNYIDRLSRTLQVDIQDTNISTLPDYPARRSRLSSITKPGSDISLLDFLKLDHCKLGNIIANKNSSLGKVATNTQILFYELAYLQYAPSCIGHLQNTQQSALLKKVISEQQSKEKYLSQSIWLAILGEKEYARFWQAPQNIGAYPKTASIEISIPLKQLYHFAKRVKDKNFSISNDEQQNIEIALSKLQTSEGGYFLKSTLLLQQKIRHANHILQTAIDKPFCSPKRHNKQADIFKTVVNLFFIQDVQVWAAKLNQRKHIFFDTALQLEEILYNPQAIDFNKWVIDRNQIIQQTSIDIITHTKLIQDLYQQCNLNIKPG